MEILDCSSDCEDVPSGREESPIQEAQEVNRFWQADLVV